MNIKERPIPNGALSCHYISERDRIEALKTQQPYGLHYTTSNYFQITKRPDATTLEGNLGRTDYPALYFDEVTRGYSFFDDYYDRKNVYFSLDKASLYQLVKIIPTKPLTVILKLTPNTIRTNNINQELIYQMIQQELWGEVLVILHKNKQDIIADPLLQSAAAIFEAEFFRKLPGYPVDDRSIIDNLDTMYMIHHGKFYTLKPENVKTLYMELARRKSGEAYRYTQELLEESGNEPPLKKQISMYTKPAPITQSSLQQIDAHVWAEIYNRLFELINQSDDPATYFSGPRFIKTIRQVLPYFPDYQQYIGLRNQQGKSTSRNIFYYDILMELDEPTRLSVVKKILNIVKPVEPEGVSAIEMLLGRKTIDAVVKEVPSTTLPPIPGSPIIFISYSWDGEAHKEWVLRLAERLQENGVTVILDRYELRAGKSVPHFVEQSIRIADKIIVIFSPNYKTKAMNRSGGVGYEYSIMNAELYQKQASNEKIIPVLRTGDLTTSIPEFMQQYIHLNMSNDENFENSLQDLLREIYNEPAIKRPALGARPVF